MSKELDALIVEVQEESGIIDSAITFIDGLKAELQSVKDQLAEAGIDNAKLNDVITTLDTKGNALANALAANPA